MPFIDHSDVCHCSDYDKKVCPKSCYRAQVTEDLKKRGRPRPTSWAHFKGTQYCELEEEKDESV